MNLRNVSAYVLRALAESQTEGRASNLETLTEAVGVRRTDVRAALTALHCEGYLDVLRMRLTLRGFAVGCALVGETLPELRPAPVAATLAA